MKQKYMIAYAVAALAFVTATAAMASFAGPTLMSQLDEATTASILRIAEAGFMF